MQKNQSMISKELKAGFCIRFLHTFFRTAGVILGFLILSSPLKDIFIWRFGPDFHWIDFPPYFVTLETILLKAGALGLILMALLPLSPWWSDIRQRISIFILTVQVLLWTFIFFACFNVIEYYFFLFNRNIASSFPVPLSLIVVVVIMMNLWRIRIESGSTARIDRNEPPLSLVKSHGVCLVLLIVFLPLTMILIYGATDHTHIFGNGQGGEFPPADCIIVYGAKVNKDGTPSGALADRVNQAVELFRSGCGRYLVMTGGANDDGESETQCMKNFAISHGVPANRIIINETGFKTYDSVLNVKKIMDDHGWRHSLSVSHNYHLLRIKLMAKRVGLNTYTVPVKNSGLIPYEAWLVVREIAALYYYYLLGCGNTDG